MSEVTQQKALSDTDRMINSGIEVELSKLGKVTVRELSLEKLIKLANSVKLIMDELATGGDDSNIVLSLLASPSLLVAIKEVAAATTDKTQEDFSDMGMMDWLKLIKAFKQVMNWEELQELFFQIVPLAMIRGLSKAE